jgi:hypothetical protein
MKKTCDVCNKEFGGFLSTKYKLKDGVVCDSCLLPFGVDAAKLKMGDLGKAIQSAAQMNVSDIKAAVDGDLNKQNEIRNILLQGTTVLKNENTQPAQVEIVKKHEDINPEKLAKDKKTLKWGLGSVLVIGIIVIVGVYLVMERGIFDSPSPRREPTPPTASVGQPTPTPESTPELTPIPTPEQDTTSGNQGEIDEPVNIRETVTNIAENDIAQAWYTAFNACNSTDFVFDRVGLSGGLVRIEHHHLIDESTRYRFFELSQQLIYFMQDTWLPFFNINLFTPRNETDLANNNVFLSYYISVDRKSLEGVDFMGLDFYEFLALATEENMTDSINR